MNGKSLLLSYVIVSAIGVLFHFAYGFFNVSYLKIVFPSNESIFEHLKLIVFPAFFYMIFDVLFFKEKKVFSSYVGGVVAAMVFTVCGYYTYSGIIGRNIDVINIILYFIAIGVVFFYRYKKITLFDGPNSVIAFCVILAFIEIFTFFVPNIGFFSVP